MYRKRSGKRSVLTYCCIYFHPSQCVLLINKRLIQILLIIGGVEQNPGSYRNLSEIKDKLYILQTTMPQHNYTMRIDTLYK